MPLRRKDDEDDDTKVTGRRPHPEQPIAETPKREPKVEAPAPLPAEVEAFLRDAEDFLRKAVPYGLTGVVEFSERATALARVYGIVP